MANARARQLRKTMSKAEQLLWGRLRNGLLDGRRFRRQHPIGPYIIDFVCLAELLVIEVDGSHHAEPERIESDAARTAWLAREGYRVVRFPTTEVHDNIDGVLSLTRLELAAEAVRVADTPTEPRPG